MEWQTPAVSEKFQSRFGRRPGTSDSVDTGLGTSASDSTEGDDFLLVLPPACRMCYVTPEICLSRLELGAELGAYVHFTGYPSSATCLLIIELTY